jgi:hypothetical protein
MTIGRGQHVGKKKSKVVDLGTNGNIKLHLSDDAKRLLIEFNVGKDGLTKTDINYLIPNLKDIREKMER